MINIYTLHIIIYFYFLHYLKHQLYCRHCLKLGKAQKQLNFNTSNFYHTHNLTIIEKQLNLTISAIYLHSTYVCVT